MPNIKKAALLLTLLIAVVSITIAQPADANQPIEMADTMRSNGKIYVVVAVLTTVLLGIVLYLIRLEKKVTALEKQQPQ